MLISTILSVVLLLGLVAYMISSSKNVQIFPATINECPDYYDLNSSNVCVANTNVWNTSSMSAGCSSINFKSGQKWSTGVSYNTPGTGKSSGICAKKQKANSCKISWDGITNNTGIC